MLKLQTDNYDASQDIMAETAELLRELSLKPNMHGFQEPHWTDEYKEELQPVLKRLRLLSGLKNNWDDMGSLRPDPKSIEKAKSWIGSFYHAVQLSGKAWSDPLVNVDEKGRIVFEWWGEGSKKITIYMSDTSRELVKIWGKDINKEMLEETFSNNYLQWRHLWNWLMSEI